MKKFYNLLDDLVYKGVFDISTPLGLTAVRHTLHVFAGTKLDESIVLMNKEHAVGLGNGKKMNMDCLFQVGDNLLVDMEAQKQNVAYDPERLINYLSVMDITFLKAGDSHAKGKCVILYFMGYPYPEGKDGMMRFQDGMMVSEKFQIKFIPVYGLNDILAKDPYEMTQEERYRVYFGYSHKEEYQGLMRKLEEMEEGLMAIHEQVLTQQSLLDFFAQMKEEDRRKQEREGIIAEYKYKMELEKKEREKEQQKRKAEEQKRKEEQQKRKAEEQKRKEEEQKRKEKEQKLKEEQQKRKAEELKRQLEHQKFDYIIKLIKQGYTVDDAEQKANQEFVVV